MTHSGKPISELGLDLLTNCFCDSLSCEANKLDFRELDLDSLATIASPLLGLSLLGVEAKSLGMQAATALLFMSSPCLPLSHPLFFSLPRTPPSPTPSYNHLIPTRDPPPASLETHLDPLSLSVNSKFEKEN